MLVVILAATVIAPQARAAGAPGAKTARAEVQIGLCTPPDQIIQALGLRPRGAAISVWQFDDAALTLFGRGLRLRLRVTAGDRSELTLKVAEQDCARLDARLVPPGEGKCEYDIYGTSRVGAVSLTRNVPANITNDLLAGRVALTQVLSPSQIEYLREVVGIWPLPSGLRGLGPMQVLTYRTKDTLYDIDVSRLPGGERYVEISRKVPLADATRTMAATKARLARAGVEMCADQTSQAASKLRALLR